MLTRWLLWHQELLCGVPCDPSEALLLNYTVFESKPPSADPVSSVAVLQLHSSFDPATCGPSMTLSRSSGSLVDNVVTQGSRGWASVRAATPMAPSSGRYTHRFRIVSAVSPVRVLLGVSVGSSFASSHVLGSDANGACVFESTVYSRGARRDVSSIRRAKTGDTVSDRAV